MNEGWRCPGCGRCYAPTMTECRYCGPDKATVTISTPFLTEPGGAGGSVFGSNCPACGAFILSGAGHACGFTPGKAQ